MDGFSLAGLLASSGKRMRLDLAERLVAHPGELGVGREEIVRQFLRSYLPKRFDVSTGFAFDHCGRVSRQLDIIVANELECPRFETVGGIRHYPCASIVAVGQVKSSITSVEELGLALENLESVKALDRSAGGKAFAREQNEQLNHIDNYLHQAFTFLFIVGDSLAQDTFHDHFTRFILQRDAHLWPNVVLALDKNLATYCCDDGICPNPMHARGVAVQRHSEADDVLMRFYLLLGRAIEVTRVCGMPYWEYLNAQQQWSANVLHSCADHPPPYLRTLAGEPDAIPEGGFRDAIVRLSESEER